MLLKILAKLNCKNKILSARLITPIAGGFQQLTYATHCYVLISPRRILPTPETKCMQSTLCFAVKQLVFPEIRPQNRFYGVKE
jgi:hypothetical protein